MLKYNLEMCIYIFKNETWVVFEIQYFKYFLRIFLIQYLEYFLASNHTKNNFITSSIIEIAFALICKHL